MRVNGRARHGGTAALSAVSPKNGLLRYGCAMGLYGPCGRLRDSCGLDEGREGRVGEDKVDRGDDAACVNRRRRISDASRRATVMRILKSRLIGNLSWRQAVGPYLE